MDVRVVACYQVELVVLDREATLARQRFATAGYHHRPELLRRATADGVA